MRTAVTRLPWPPVGAALLLAYFGWRAVVELPAAGLDTSWQAALHMAAHSNLGWGDDLVFTYGPLGWLRVPTFWYADSGALALAYLVAGRVVALAVIWTLARRTFGWLGALVVLLPVAWLMDDPIPALGFAVAAWLMIDEHPERRQILMVAGLGALGALESLGKINAGATVVLCTLVAIGFMGPRRWVVRLLLIWSGTFTAVLLAAWLGSGQGLTDLGDYVINSARIVSGYSQAMIVEDPAARWEYWAAANIWIAGLLALWLGCTTRTSRARLGLVALWTAYFFISFRSGFVRHEAGHGLVFFSAVAPAVAILPWRRGVRERLLAIALVALPVYCFLDTTKLALDDVVAPIDHARAARAQLEPLWSSVRRAALREEGRKQVIAAEALAPATLSALRGHTVTATPSELAIVWAHQLRWDPEPVLQGYQAYTPGLAALNERKLRSSSAPERLLTGPNTSIDSRLASFDTPAEARARVCRYQPQLRQHDRWLVLTRRAYACSPQHLVGSLPADWGQVVQVPEPGPRQIVMVRIAGAGVRGYERLRSSLFKAFERSVDLGPAGVHRVVPGTLGSGLPLRSGALADLPGPFAIAPDATTISLDRSDHPRGGTPLRYDFYSVDVAGLRTPIDAEAAAVSAARPPRTPR